MAWKYEGLNLGLLITVTSNAKYNNWVKHDSLTYLTCKYPLEFNLISRIQHSRCYSFWKESGRMLILMSYNNLPSSPSEAKPNFTNLFAVAILKKSMFVQLQLRPQGLLVFLSPPYWKTKRPWGRGWGRLFSFQPRSKWFREEEREPWEYSTAYPVIKTRKYLKTLNLSLIIT